MTKLPPGFTHEMRHHLTHKAVELDPLTGVPVLPLEDFCCGLHVQRPIPNRQLPILIQPRMDSPL
jgi:hypothetical protein